jgi:glycine cleavage system aminomethyltransferase T
LVGLVADDDAPDAFAYPERIDRIKELPTLTRDANAVRADTTTMSLDHAAGVELFALNLDNVEAVADEISEGGPLNSSPSPRKAAGRITSGVMSPRLKRALFLGYVRTPMAGVGTQFHAHIGGHNVTLSVVSLPLPSPIKGDKHA